MPSTGTISKKQKDAINAGKSERLKKALKLRGVNVHDSCTNEYGKLISPKWISEK